MSSVELLRSLRVRNKLSGNALLEALNALPIISPLRLPPGFDDSRQHDSLVQSLTEAERREFGLTLPTQLAPHGRALRSAAAQQAGTRTYHVRVQAILCANDDGSGGAARSSAVDADYVGQLLELANQTYHTAGVQFVYDPSTDFERLNSSLLNLDFTVPDGLDLDRPESQSPFDGLDTFEGGQSNWRYCSKCQGLFHAGLGHGQCPAGGQHDPSSSADYSLLHNRSDRGQRNWRWCRKCQGLFFAGSGGGVCPSGQQHDPSASRDYCLMFTTPGLGQGGWRWCKKCQGLFHTGHSSGSCPAGSQHDGSASGAYDLMGQQENLAIAHLLERQGIAEQFRGRMVVFFCDGNSLVYKQGTGWTIIDRTFAFSGQDLEFVGMSAVKSPDLTAHAYLFAHESGHYFHLAHTHASEFTIKADVKKAILDDKDLSADEKNAAILKEFVDAAGKAIREYVDQGHGRAQGADVFDGDNVDSSTPVEPGTHVVSDTPPDPSWELLHYANTVAGGFDCCGSVGSASIPVFSDRPDYVLRPDRSNAMSYFKGCTNFTQQFSPDQRAGIRTSMEKKNRSHLIHRPAALLIGADQFTAGPGPLTFVVTVRNHGPRPEAGLLTLRASKPVSVVASSHGHATVAPNRIDVTAKLTGIPAGQSATLTLRTTVTGFEEGITLSGQIALFEGPEFNNSASHTVPTTKDATA